MHEKSWPLLPTVLRGWGNHALTSKVIVRDSRALANCSFCPSCASPIEHQSIRRQRGLIRVVRYPDVVRFLRRCSQDPLQSGLHKTELSLPWLHTLTRSRVTPASRLGTVIITKMVAVSRSIRLKLDVDCQRRGYVRKCHINILLIWIDDLYLIDPSPSQTRNRPRTLGRPIVFLSLLTPTISVSASMVAPTVSTHTTHLPFHKFRGTAVRTDLT
jgi:hypothetical protein